MNGIWTYNHLLPAIEQRYKLSLGEGDTPLLRSRNLGPMLGIPNLYFKMEMLNPSGSYKDRFAAAAVSDLLRRKAVICIATSSGNTGAALAAYCAAATIKCIVAIVDGTPVGKLRQMQAYGATTLTTKDFGKNFQVTKDVMEGLAAIAQDHNSLVQISSYSRNPFAMTGVQTIAYEVADALPEANKQVFSPAGGGGLTLAIAEGFKKWKDAHPAFSSPRVHCVQPEGNDTLCTALREDRDKAKAIPISTTSISGLQVPNILDGDRVIAACRASGGTGYLVPDDLVFECRQQLALQEGIFCEPAGAVAYAGLVKALRTDGLNRQDHIICVITGHGFKDPVSAGKMAGGSKALRFRDEEEVFKYIKKAIAKPTRKK